MTERVNSKTQAQIVGEWDALSETRLMQITGGKDITYNHTLIPAVQRLIGTKHVECAIDAGCGIGALTPILKQGAQSVVGIDPSEKNINLARRHFGKSADFHNLTLQAYVDAAPETRAQLVVANMVLMDVLDLAEFLRAASSLLVINSLFIFTIPHPWFWPVYAGYSDQSWFDYKNECIIEAPFGISRDRQGVLISTHVHRPISKYFQALHENNLHMVALEELFPDTAVHHLYERKWMYPRYLAGKCVKVAG